MDLPNEQNPRPLPQATGAVPGPMQKWISFVVLGAVVFFMVIGWAISRWSGPKLSVMAARHEPAKATGSSTGPRQLNEALEQAYERGKREGKAGSGSQSQSQQSSGNSQATQAEKVLTPQQEYAKLMHYAAMTDNMVEGRRSNDAYGVRPIGSGNGRDDAGGYGYRTPSSVDRGGLEGTEIGRNGRTNDSRNERTTGLDNALAGSHYLSRPNEANSPDDGREMPDPSSTYHGDDRGSTDRKTPIRRPAENVLPEGTEIACTLVNQLGGDNTGPVKVQVENDIPFPRTDEIAIPQGSLLHGEARMGPGQFQQRLAVSFHMLQIGVTAGNSRQISLDKFPGLDIQGEAALRDQVNNHYASIFGASLAIGAIGGLAQIGNSNSYGYNGIDSGTQVRNGISQSMAQSATQILNHFLNRPPTITIRPGHHVIVHLTANLEIPQ